MTYLVDVNVWLALADEGHVHHAAARDWFEESSSDTKYFCRTTQQALLRLLTNAHIMGPHVLNAAGAWKIYDAFRSDDSIKFAQEPEALESSWRALTVGASSGHNFWTDRYLAAFALASNSTIVSFDQAFRSMKGVSSRILSTT
jgi:uncharacterized protein